MKRDIRTTLAVDGETKFKQEMQAAARELRTLQSEARANTAAFGDNAKSIEGLTQRNKDLAAVAEQQRENVRALTRAVEDAAQKYGEADRRTDGYRIQLNNARTALAKTETEIEKNNKSIAKLSDKWKQAGLAAEKAGKNISKAGKNISDAGSKLTRNVTVPLVAMGAAALKASVDFETAFTGVLKTVSGTEEQIAKLKQGIIDMSLVLPASTKEIAAVAELAGQLGIKTDNVLAFSRTMLDLGETTNIASAEAAKLLAQFANITQMGQEDFGRLGSVVVALGNNFETTEADIVSMAHRLAGAGKQIGLTEAQIMGFSTALASVGVRAEAGGTAFSKIFSEMQVSVETGNKRLQDFAKVSGMTATEFQRAFKDDAAVAITAFIEGLSKMSEEGMSSILVLEEMGITELRLRDSLLRVSNAGDLVRSSLDLATKSWGENIALTREAELRYGTTASQAKILYNETKEAARQFGDAMVPALREAIGEVKPLIRGFAELSTEQKLNIIRTAGFVAAIGPAAKIIGGVTSAIGGGTRAFGLLSKAISSAGGLAAVISGPAGWAVLGAAALGGMAYMVSKNVAEYRELTKEARELDKAMENASQTFRDAQNTFDKTSSEITAAASLAEGYIQRLEELEQAGLDSAVAQTEHARTVEMLKGLIPGISIEIDAQTGKIIGGTAALLENTKAWKANAVAQALQAKLQAETAAYTDALVEQSKKTAELQSMEAELAKRRAANASKNEKDSRRFVDVGIAPLEKKVGALKDSLAASDTNVAAMAKNLQLTEEATKGIMDDLIQTPIEAGEKAAPVAKESAKKVTKAVARGISESMPEVKVTLRAMQTLIDESFRETVGAALAQSKEMSIAVQQEFGTMADSLLVSLSRARAGESGQDTAGQVGEMTEKSVQIVKEQQRKSLERLATHHHNIGTLESEEYAAEVDRLTALYDSKIDVIRNRYAQIADIIQAAMYEGREVTIEESLAIGDILSETTASMVDEVRRREAQIAAIMASGEGPDAIKEQGEQILAVLEGTHEDQLSKIRASTQEQVQQLIEAYERGEIAEIAELQGKVARVRDSEAEQTRLAYTEHATRMKEYKNYWDAMGLTVDEGTGRIIERTEEYMIAVERQQEAWAKAQARRSSAQWGEIGQEAVSGLVTALGEHGPEAESAARTIGSNIGESFAEGIAESTAKVDAAAKQVATVAEKAMKAELQIASPSRKFKGFGVNAYESFATALEDGKGRVRRAVGVLANSITMPSFGSPAFSGAGGGATTIQVTNNFHVTGSMSQNELNKVTDYANQGLSKALRKRGNGRAVL